MDIAIVTGSGGLIGAQAVRYFSHEYDLVIGVDNDLRAYFFGDEASTRWAVDELQGAVGNYEHRHLDIRDRAGVDQLFASYGSDIGLVVHTAAQPSHDWAAKEPFTDFDVNAVGTLNLLEATRLNAPRGGVHLHLDQQGLRRHPEPAAPGRAGAAVGARRGPPLARARHPRGDVARQLGPQPVRGVGGGGRRDVPGVRPLLRSQDRHLPRRLPHRARPLRGPAPRLPRLPHEVHGHR